jgi:hypothetical protein
LKKLSKIPLDLPLIKGGVDFSPFDRWEAVKKPSPRPQGGLGYRKRMTAFVKLWRYPCPTDSPNYFTSLGMKGDLDLLSVRRDTLLSLL